MELKKVVSVVVVFVMIFLVAVSASCQKTTTTKQIKIFACSPFEDQYFSTWLEGATAAAKLLNVELSSGSAGWDLSKQNDLIQSAVSAGAQGVLVARVDLDAFIPLSEQLNKKGIAVVTTDGPIHNGPRLAHFSTDGMTVGKEIGTLLIEGLQKSGKPKPWYVVGFAGLPGTYDGMTRIEGALAVMNSLISSGDIILVSTEIANFDRQLAMQKMQGILTKNQKIDGVFAANDDMALGAMKACEAAGIVPGKDTLFVGVDTIPDAQQAILQGKEYGSVSQAPYLEGYWGVTTLYAYLQYGIRPDSVGMPVPTVTVTKDNINTFESAIKFDKPLPADYFTGYEEQYLKFINQFWPTS